MEEVELVLGERKCLNKENLITARTLITPTTLKQNNISLENINLIFFCFYLNCFSPEERNVLCCVGGCFLLEILWAAGAAGNKDTGRTESIELLPAFIEAAKYFHGFHSESKIIFFFLNVANIVWSLAGRPGVVVVVGCCWLLWWSLCLLVASVSAAQLSARTLSSNKTRPAGRLTVLPPLRSRYTAGWLHSSVLPPSISHNHRITREGDNGITFLLTFCNLFIRVRSPVVWAGGGAVDPVARPQ